MMAGHEYSYNTREPNQVYTPSLDSDDDMPHMAALDLSDKNYRLFSFRRDGRSWSRAQHSELSLPESEIKARAKRPRKEKHTVEHQMKKMSLPRKTAIEDLLESVKLQDPLGDDWDIVAIDNENAELTKRTGEVLAFSIILARQAPGRPPSNPRTTGNATTSTTTKLPERRKSMYASSTQEPSMPGRRASKLYDSNPILDKAKKSTQPPKPARPANFEDDPFGISHLFSSEGKPLDPIVSTPYSNANPGSSRTTQTLFGESTTTKSQKLPKEKPGKKGKKSKDDGPVDFDAIFSLNPNAADLLGDPLEDNHQDYHLDQDDHHFDDYDDSLPDMDPEDHDLKTRGRKRNDSGFASQTPKPSTGQKSKSRPRKPSVHIPKENRYGNRPVEINSYDTPQYTAHDTPKYSSHPFDLPPQDKYATRTVPVDVTINGRRRHQQYHSSQISAETAPSARSYSDHSILEAEYEEYSSSNSSEDQDRDHFDHSQSDAWQNPYTNPDGRYKRATRDHRRGPPSPQYPRHDTRYEPEPIPYGTTTTGPASTSSSTHRSRPNRPLSDIPISSTSGPLQRYYTSPPTPSTATPRPPLISQSSRPSDSYYQQLYPVTSSNLIYPSDLRAHEARNYITTHADRDKDQEIERLQWENHMARREAELARKEMEMHREDARRASVVVGGARREVQGGMGDGFPPGGGMGGGIGGVVGGGERRSGRRYTHEPRMTRRYTDAYYG